MTQTQDPNEEIMRRLGIPNTGDIHRMSILLQAGRIPTVVIERWVVDLPGQTEASRYRLELKPDPI